MAIGSCTSCHSGNNYTQSAREQQNVDRTNNIASEQTRIQEQQQVQESFRPDPNRLLDIQA
jgi:hypothetical protein